METAQAMAMENRLTLGVNALRKTFNKTVALDNVSFLVPEGSLAVLLGPAGAGKTTTLRCIAGLDRPDAGRIVLDGVDVGKWEPKDRDVAMIFDTLALYPNKTGFENIANPLKIRGTDPVVVDEKVAEVARTLKVSRLLNRLPKTMSGGERQRIALGRALIRAPKLFLLDEPLSSLDAMLRIELRAELKRLQRELGRTFLMATPDFNEALAVADTVIMLREGKVAQIAPPQEIYDNPADKDVAAFIGSPQINLVPALYETGPHGHWIAAAGAQLPVPDHLKPVLEAHSREFILGIRPEILAPADEPEAAISGELIDIEPLGLKSVIAVRNATAELRLVVESADTRGLALHQNLGLKVVNPARLLAFDGESGRLLN